MTQDVLTHNANLMWQIKNKKKKYESTDLTKQNLGQNEFPNPNHYREEASTLFRS